MQVISVDAFLQSGTKQEVIQIDVVNIDVVNSQDNQLSGLVLGLN